MSSEVCPFCGKIYKRLKSHLPHCKAAASPNTPPTKHVAASETASSSSQLVAPFSGPTAESTKTLSVTLIPQSKKGKKMSTASLSPDSSSLPPPTKKTKQKPSQQIKRAVAPSSITDSLVSIASPPPPVPKKQSLRALIEAAKAKHATEGTGSASEDRPPGSGPSVADPLSSGATKEADAPPAVLSAADEPTAASEKKVAKTKKAAEYLSATRGASNPPDSRVHERDDFWVEDENGEVEELSVNKRFLKSGSGHKARITLQDVKATLGRANGPRQPGRPSILSQVETTDNANAKCKIAPVPLPPPAAPLLTGQLSSLPRTVSVNGVPKVTGVLALSPTHTEFTNPLLAARGGTLRAGTSRGGDGLKLRPGVREQNAADRGTKGGLAQRSLAQVKLRELPEWLTCRTPSHPREVVEMVQGGWQWYYKKYIDVKKGGAGGLGMLLAGYCALSYIWSYPHMKRDRWRKYH
uniref:ATP synthase membrane subunit f n=1 Tax=Gasterosteus aculeatus aculeatus TaxID=481459 RepID=G3NFW4_GASAC|nr:uncharacterized protein C17orf80 homolog [Gasterosteus aculeatus aculeatus]